MVKPQSSGYLRVSSLTSLRFNFSQLPVRRGSFMSHPANQPATNRPLTTADVSPPDAVPEGVEARAGGFRVPTDTLRAYTMIIALVAIWLFFQWRTISPLYPYGIFLHPNNFSNLLQQMAVTGVLAVGMLMVIVAGQIDLSVGSVVGLAGGGAAMMPEPAGASGAFGGGPLVRGLLRAGEGGPLSSPN